jgi:hypothetical protein
MHASETQGRGGRTTSVSRAKKAVSGSAKRSIRSIREDSIHDRRDGLENDSSYRYAIARPANATASQQISDRHAATLASPVLTFTLEFVAFLWTVR